MRLVVARCQVDYAGRLTAHLPMANRVLMIKADGSVLVHSDGGSYKPLNWMSPPCTVREAVSDDGQVLVLGGTPDDRRLLRSTELYDPATRSFTPGPRLVTGRYKLAGSVALARNGDVVVAGGGRGAEVLNLQSGISRTLAAVPPDRMSFSTVSALGDTVRILGGYDENIDLTGTDINTTLPDGG